VVSNLGVMGSARGFREIERLLAVHSHGPDCSESAVLQLLHHTGVFENSGVRAHVQEQGRGTINSIKEISPRPSIGNYVGAQGLVVDRDLAGSPSAVVAGYRKFPEIVEVADWLAVSPLPPPPPSSSSLSSLSHCPSPAADGQCLKFIIGILTTSSAKNEEVEANFRLWLPVVGPDLSLRCGLNFVFVYGTPATPRPGRIVLDIKENMNEGKSLQYFKEASALFPSADYVYKMDTDMGVCLDDLLSTLVSAASSGADYVGWRQNYVSCGMQPRCPPYGADKEDWFFMSGSFYGMRRELVLLVTGSEENARKNIGDEDLMMGRMVHRVLPSPKAYDIACLFDREDYIDPDTKVRWVGNMVDAQSVDCPLRHFQTLRFPDRNTASVRSICQEVDGEKFYVKNSPKRAEWEPSWAVN